MMSEQKMDVKTTDTELTFRRLFEAPPDLVFEAYSSCEHLRYWWGPRTWPMNECTLEFRVGGEWLYCLRGPNEGDEAWGKAIYEEIVKPHRLVYRDYFCDKEGQVNPDLPSTLVTMTFSRREGNTLMTGHALYEKPADLEQVLAMGMVEGMTESLDRLDEHLAQVVRSD